MKKYAIVGNRFQVMEAMMKHGINPVKILAVKDSHLEKKLKKLNIIFDVIKGKAQLCDLLDATEFDYLISNGCPYILPVSLLKKPHQQFINIHPSFLPDLKGRNPVNGAMLFNCSAGASCHIMDDGIDTGPIISRIKISLTPDIDLGLLYQLSFMAEKEVFLDALKKNFIPDKSTPCLIDNASLFYYTRKRQDMLLNLQESSDVIIRRIKAFGVASQMAYFVFNQNTFYVRNAEIITNPYLLSKAANYAELEIVFVYDNTIVIKKQENFLKLTGLIGNMSKLQVELIL